MEQLRQPDREPPDPAASGDPFVPNPSEGGNVHSQRDLSRYVLNPDELREKKKELLRLGGTREQIVKALKSAILKPDQREQFKKALSLYDAKIRTLRDQLIASDLLCNLNPDEIKIPAHYQDRKR